MSIETAITDAWQRKAPWLWLLLPISWLYGSLIRLRHQAYKLGWLASYRAPLPVMVIGNITVGGSGKTPLIIALVDHLQQQGVRVGVISRGYGGDSSQMPTLVTHDSVPSVVGDEPCLIVNMTAVPMAVCPNRQQAIETLLVSYPDLQLIIADDGLQHYALQRDIEWIVVDVTRGFGNKQLLPTGFLREPMSRLRTATLVYHEPSSTASASTRQESVEQRLTMQLQPDGLQPLWSKKDTERLGLRLLSTKMSKPRAGDTVHAVSGIGYPKRFFDTLQSLGFEVIEHPYPDHHDFDLTELLQYTQHPVVVTSKDAVKIKAVLSQAATTNTLTDQHQALINRLWVLPVTAKLSTACYQRLKQQLTDFDITVSD